MEPMNFLEVQGNYLVSRSSDLNTEAIITECATQEAFDAWRNCWSNGQSAARFQNVIYVKVPISLDEYGEFYLDCDVLPVPEANALIALWNERYKKWLMV